MGFGLFDFGKLGLGRGMLGHEELAAVLVGNGRDVEDTGSGITILISSVDRKAPCRRLGGAERSGTGHGCVSHIYFTASDFERSSSGMVKVSVPHSVKSIAIDGGELFDSTH